MRKTTEQEQWKCMMSRVQRKDYNREQQCKAVMQLRRRGGQGCHRGANSPNNGLIINYLSTSMHYSMLGSEKNVFWTTGSDKIQSLLIMQ